MAGLRSRAWLVNSLIAPQSLRVFSTALPERVRLVEVGPRDGLQNESKAVSLETKLLLIQKLAESGLTHIEAGAFVSPKMIPQMADSEKILRHLSEKLFANSNDTKRFTGDSSEAQALRQSYSFLVPNLQGLQRAFAVENDKWREETMPNSSILNEVAVFAAATETFSQKNINCSIEESLKRFEPVVQAAKKKGIRVRGYVSVVLGCPYEGKNVSPIAVTNLAKRLWEMGVDEVSLGDTIGTGTPEKTKELLHHIIQSGLPRDVIAMHFHDTYGNALANITASLEEGIRIFDSSVGGLGGCPFARGATGNVATEDVIQHLDGLGFDCGINLESIKGTSAWIREQLDKGPSKRVEQS
ncbi:MAG: hypothetical protein M1814_006833 [Vezdaea aestivalis]|nr:MAG: hypothetical protein M1814_006833 [Vezdaea aestivalis]